MRRRVLVPVLAVGLLIASCSSDAGDEGAGVDDAEVTVDEPDIDVGEPTGWPVERAGTAVELCPDRQPAFPTDLDVRPEVEMPEPAPHQAYRDDVYGGCVVRVTDRQRDPAPDDPSRGMKNEYSRVQSFNADGSLLMVRSLEARYSVYDAASLERLGSLPDMVDPRWSNVDPDLVYFIGDLTLSSFDLSSGEQRVVHDFVPDFPGEALTAVWTRWEGSPSIDDRWWGLMAQDEEYLVSAFVIYDLVEDRIVARRDLDPHAEVDNVTMSPLGTWLLAQFEYCESGGTGTGQRPCGLMVYDRTLEEARGLLRVVGHSDVALDADGDEVFVYQELDTDSIAVLDLATGAITNLFPIDFTHCDGCGMHFSGLAHERPGWGLVSYYDGDPTTHMWMDDHVFAIELAPGGRVVRFAQHHSLVDPDQEHDYWAEPHASVNPDFTRLLFTSNWGRSGTGEVDLYLVALPADWDRG